MADADVRREREVVRDLQQLADLLLGGHEQRRHRGTEPLGAQAEQQVLHERIDRGAADDALAWQLGVGHGEVLQAHADDQVHGHLVERSRVFVGAAATMRSRRGSKSPGFAQHLRAAGLLHVLAPRGRYRSRIARRRSASRTTTTRQPWRLPPLGAKRASSSARRSTSARPARR